MKFNEYQELAARTAITNDLPSKKLANFSMGLCGEAGEVTDYLKKVLFHKHEFDKDKLTKELGDVLWYLSQIALLNDIELEDVARQNIEKLKRRYPEGFSMERSINRDD